MFSTEYAVNDAVFFLVVIQGLLTEASKNSYSFFCLRRFTLNLIPIIIYTFVKMDRIHFSDVGMPFRTLLQCSITTQRVQAPTLGTIAPGDNVMKPTFLLYLTIVILEMYSVSLNSLFLNMTCYLT